MVQATAEPLRFFDILEICNGIKLHGSSQCQSLLVQGMTGWMALGTGKKRAQLVSCRRKRRNECLEGQRNIVRERGVCDDVAGRMKPET